MASEEYWIGKGIHLDEVWADFDEGQSYIQKFESRPVHLMTLDFAGTRITPLYNHEAIFKTVKFYFHEVKALSLSSRAYNESLPLFLYDIERGSSKYTFVGEVAQLVMFGTTVTEQEIIGLQMDNFGKRLDLLQRFGVNPQAHAAQIEAFQRAHGPRQLQAAMDRMLTNGLREVFVSEVPLLGDGKEAKGSMRSIGRIDYRV